MKTIPSSGKVVIIVSILLFVGILLFLTTASVGQYDKRAAVLSPLEGWEVGGIWHPTKEDIAGLEASLEQISHMNAENYPKNNNVHIDHPERYFRQYVGVIRGWKRRIYVNAFCGEFPPEPGWQKRLVDILDGGTCVWQAVFGPQREQVHISQDQRSSVMARAFFGSLTKDPL
jgi:hypothetical protein